MSADASSIIKENGDITYRSLAPNTNATLIKSANASAEEISNTNSYSWPVAFSSDANMIPYLYFYLRNSDYEAITGIVVDKIEIYQQENLILSTTNVSSYSNSGRYLINNAALKSKFKNGDNEVDVVFYKNGIEVARLEDFTLHCYANTIVTELYSNEVGTERNEFPLRVRGTTDYTD